MKRLKLLSIGIYLVAFCSSNSFAGKLIHLQMTEGSGVTTANTGTIGGNADIDAGLTWMSDGPGGNNAISFGTIDNDTTYTNGIMLAPAVISNQLDGLANYTVTMWIRLNADMSGNNSMHTLMETQDVTGVGAPSLWIERNDTRFHIRDNGDRSGTNGTFAANVGTWQFVAFSLDGNDGAGQNDGTGRAYTGTETVAATLTDTLSNLLDNSSTEGDRFKVGGSLDTWTVHSLPGDFADVRFYDELLDVSAIEAIRAEAIPEPSTLALAFLGLLGLLGRRRRKQ